MTTFISKRKKYVREMKADWWKKDNFYKFYIVREATALFALWFSIELLYGLICLAGNPLIGYVDFLAFLQNPLVMILNLVSLGMALLNTVTYFQMTPKVMRISLGEKTIKPQFIYAGLWATTAIVSLIVLITVF